jgi:hypothetical protein
MPPVGRYTAALKHIDETTGRIAAEIASVHPLTGFDLPATAPPSAAETNEVTSLVVPPESVPPPEPVFRLSGIGRGAARRAIVNGQVLKMGDGIEGYRVVAIEADFIVLEDDAGKRKVVRLLEDVRKWERPERPRALPPAP